MRTKLFLLLSVLFTPLLVQADPQPLERDRAAILAMVGEYRVDFEFRETVAMTPGYQRAEPYHETATELVKLIRDEPGHIALQHILVLHPRQDDPRGPQPPRVVKHWRQDWRYEPDATWEYLGHQIWQRRELSPELSSGRWVQEVYQVDDSPRYAALGRWTHVDPDPNSVVGSFWESEPKRRPLPRREWLVRDDYHALLARNRQSITPDGWTHEQDNLKLVLDQRFETVRVIAREYGNNGYVRVNGTTGNNIDFSAGYDYWRATADFWKIVRDDWEARLRRKGRFELKRSIEGRPMFRTLFEHAQTIATRREFDLHASQRFVVETLDRYYQPRE